MKEKEIVSSETPVSPKVDIIAPRIVNRASMLATIAAAMIMRHGRPLNGREDELAENAARVVNALLEV